MTPKVMMYLHMGMGIFYLFCAFLLGAFPPAALQNPGWIRYVFGLLLLLYGVFRISRALPAIRKLAKEEKEKGDQG